MDAVSQWIAWASQGNNWIAFLIVGLIGLFLGWLFTRIPASKKRGELEARVAELESQQRKSTRLTDDLTKANDDLRKSFNQAQNELDQAKAELETTSAELARVNKELDAANQTIEEQTAELKSQDEAAKKAQSALSVSLDESEQARGEVLTQIDMLRSEYEIAVADVRVIAQRSGRDGTSARWPPGRSRAPNRRGR